MSDYIHFDIIAYNRGILYRYIMLGRGICDQYQSRDEKYPEPKGEAKLV
jgi:hypothetical protein